MGNAYYAMALLCVASKPSQMHRVVGILSALSVSLYNINQQNYEFNSQSFMLHFLFKLVVMNFSITNAWTNAISDIYLEKKNKPHMLYHIYI